MKTEWIGNRLQMTAAEGSYLNAQDCHDAWINERLKPARQKRALAKHATIGEARRLLHEANELEAEVAKSRYRYSEKSSRGEVRFVVNNDSLAQARNRLTEYEKKTFSNDTLLSGYAAVFYRPDADGTEYRLGGNLIERVAQNAFSDTLGKSHDVKALWSHNDDAPLASTKAGTLTLTQDSIGLRFTLRADSGTSWGANLISSVKRGDVSGMSFSFKVQQQAMGRELGKDIRLLQRVHLIEISPVTFPAYTACSIAIM